MLLPSVQGPSVDRSVDTLSAAFVRRPSPKANSHRSLIGSGFIILMDKGRRRNEKKEAIRSSRKKRLFLRPSGNFRSRSSFVTEWPRLQAASKRRIGKGLSHLFGWGQVRRVSPPSIFLAVGRISIWSRSSVRVSIPKSSNANFLFLSLSLISAQKRKTDKKRSRKKALALYRKTR